MFQEECDVMKSQTILNRKKLPVQCENAFENLLDETKQTDIFVWRDACMTTPQCGGFKTALGKTVSIKEESLIKNKKSYWMIPAM